MQHLNDDLLCCVHADTSGPDFNCHSLVHVVIVPLMELGTHPTKILFDARMRPRYPDVDMSWIGKKRISQRVSDAVLNGIDPDDVAMMFESWFHDLELPLGKKIVPLAYNWARLQPFFTQWLSFSAMQDIFSWEYRDLIPACSFVNDKQHVANVRYSYPKRKLRFICNNTTGEPHEQAHSLLTETKYIIDAYTAMCSKTIGVL